MRANRRRLLEGGAALVAGCLVALGALLALLLAEHETALTLPTPTGPYAVGRLSYDWTDQSRVDTLAPVPGRKRRLAVWVWYPAPHDLHAGLSEYLPLRWRTAIEDNLNPVNRTFLTRDLSLVRAHAISGAEVAPDRHTYPVLVMRPGYGAEITDYTTLAEDLASHGYVVVGVSPTYTTSVVVFSDGTVATATPAGHPPEDLPAQELNRRIGALMPIWSADTSFVLDELARIDASDQAGRLTGRLDLGAIGVFGHSLGGAIAAQFCHDDGRCRAGIDVDGAPVGSVVRGGLDRPFMFVTSDPGNFSNPANREIVADIRAIYAGLPPRERYWIAVRGAQHFNFSDQALLKDPTISRVSRMTGPIDPRRGLAVASGMIRWFFDASLEGAPANPGRDLARTYPEGTLVIPPDQAA